jgi:hypothetical protein
VADPTKEPYNAYRFNAARARAFAARRLEQGYSGTVIKTFDVPTSYVDALRASAVPERLARRFPDRPFAVDVNQAADQFGLRPANFSELMSNIIPGSGGILS